MKISVITPTFRAAPCIMTCIDSVAAQHLPVFEHIIMDGASDDGTIEKVGEACAHHPHLKLFSERDGGIYDAMNKGLAHATGDYVLFLGADDQMARPDVTGEVVRKVADERPDVIYGNVLAVGTGIPGIADGEIYGGEFDLARLVRRNICHQAIFYSRSIIEKAGLYNTKYRLYADWDYNLRCYQLGTFKYIDVVVARYNTAGRSVTEEDFVFHASYFEELRRYFGLSVFNRIFRDIGPYIGFSGKLRLRLFRDPRGLIYLVAACWHSPAYVAEQFGVVWRKCVDRRREAT